MNYTGERPILEKKDDIESSRKRYHSIIPFCLNKSILDLGCGVGHGSYYLAQHTSQQVVGYDICDEAIQVAKSNFNLSNLSFQVSTSLPEEELENFDILSMVEFIEHLEHTEAIEFLAMCAQFKHLSLAITTPNGNTFSYQPIDALQYRGFHKWHYTLNDFKFLEKFYKFVDVYAHLYDPAIDKFTSYVIFASNNV